MDRTTQCHLFCTKCNAARGFPELERMMPPEPSHCDTSDQDRAKTEDQAAISKRSLAHLTFRKPPYTYVGMIALAIESSPYKRLPLSSIYESITLMFPDVFSGEYQGWRDSVRHTLSKKACFLRVQKNHSDRSGSYWTVDLSKVAQKEMDRTINIDLYITRKFCSTLTAHLGLPDLHLTRRKQDRSSRQKNQQFTEQEVDRQQMQPRRNMSFTMDSILGTETYGREQPTGIKFQQQYGHPGKQVSIVKPHPTKQEHPDVNDDQLLESILNEGNQQEDQSRATDNLIHSQDHQLYEILRQQAAPTTSFDPFSYPMLNYPLRELPSLSCASDDSAYWPYYTDVNSFYLPQRHVTY